MASFEGKVVAITGGASGIGLATAKLLASRHATLSLCDIQDEKLQEAARICRDAGAPDVSTFVVDVGDSGTVNRWIESVVSKHGKLDHAANIAGLGDKPGNRPQALKDTTDENWNFVMAVNATGVCVPRLSDEGST
ncbi:hypothetical protein LTR44_011446 [Exophiala sp. CCFEE 6388]|nr:hypothetical protein LTR44_011446 [Eurotiomycetes sp. CCFEE 6388]